MLYPEEDWKDQEEKDLDLELENESLSKDLELKQGHLFKASDCDPRLYNAFLKNINAYDSLDSEPKRPIQSIFPEDFSFPPVQKLKKKELKAKLDEIVDILERNNIQVSCALKLPDTLLYTYLTQEVIPHETTFPPNDSGFIQIIDGCSGSCGDCFQREYCDMKMSDSPDECDD